MVIIITIETAMILMQIQIKNKSNDYYSANYVLCILYRRMIYSFCQLKRQRTKRTCLMKIKWTMLFETNIANEILPMFDKL